MEDTDAQYFASSSAYAAAVASENTTSRKVEYETNDRPQGLLYDNQETTYAPKKPRGNYGRYNDSDGYKAPVVDNLPYRISGDNNAGGELQFPESLLRRE